MHIYSLPRTINNVLVTKERAGQCDRQRVLLSPELVKNVKHTLEPMWLTADSESFNKIAPPSIRSCSPFQTAVALHLELNGGVHKNIKKGGVVFVLYAFDEIHHNNNALKFLKHVGTAAVICIRSSFPIVKRYADEPIEQKDNLPLHSSMTKIFPCFSHSVSFDAVDMQQDGDEIDLNMEFEFVRDVEIFKNGSRCTIYEGRTGEHTDILMKVVRKDAEDKELVKSELQVEINLLRRVNLNLPLFFS